MCDPHAATHVPLAPQKVLPTGLRNDVKRSGNRLVAGSFDRFATYARRLQRRAHHRGRPRAMTPKIARYLADHQPATPCLVLDVDRVEQNFRAMRAAMPLAQIYYAVKANPAHPVPVS